MGKLDNQLPLKAAILAKILGIKNWQAVLAIVVIGVAVLCKGLTSPFQGDDLPQIVNNIPVHSIVHIRSFFEGSTFYVGHGLAGTNYRPLMTTAFSLLYTLFGPHPIYFHLFQLLLVISSAIILYYIFRYSFQPILSLILAVIFLVHPLNSQVAYAIPSMQDALFFFFGILGMLLLLRYASTKSLAGVAICLFLSMLSKETGVVFIAIATLYLFWFSRKRLFAFLGIIAMPFALWAALRIHAVGVANSYGGPIGTLSLASRLMNIPSILFLYISKCIFPWKLASNYYWVYPTFSLHHFLLPLIVDIVALAGLILMGVYIKKHLPKEQYYAYLFFGAWTVIGLIPYLQIFPLDMTACETWVYVSMAGALGMIGVTIVALQSHIRPELLLLSAAIIITLLGVRTAIRATDWHSQYTLARKDIAASQDDYSAYTSLSEVLIDRGMIREAETYEARSISIYPDFNSYNNMGLIQIDLGNYAAAVNAFTHALTYSDGNPVQVYENLGGLTLVYGTPENDDHFFGIALKASPDNTTLWTELATYTDEHGDDANAKVYIEKAAMYGPVSSPIYRGIESGKPFVVKYAYRYITI